MQEAPLQKFQILALSGGGFRGLYTAKILADLEEEIGALWLPVEIDLAKRHIGV